MTDESVCLALVISTGVAYFLIYESTKLYREIKKELEKKDNIILDQTVKRE